jgi:hypothetical protein
MVVTIAFVVAFLVLAPLILYLIARARAARDPIPDPQLGLKFALHYFAMSSFQVLLAGGSLLIYNLISPGTAEKGTSGYRIAMGLIIPAGLVLAAHVGLLKRTTDDALPGVRRLFWGYNMLVTGMLAFVALLLGFQALFAKGTTFGLGHFAGSMVVVYGAAWAIVGFKFGQMVLGGPSGGGTSAGMMIDPTAAPPVYPTPPAQSHTGLPALGGGSFPPIDQR